MNVNPTQVVKCSYCETTMPAGQFPILVMGKGEVKTNGMLQGRFRAICPECIINTFDAAHRPQTVTP